MLNATCFKEMHDSCLIMLFDKNMIALSQEDNFVDKDVKNVFLEMNALAYL